MNCHLARGAIPGWFVAQVARAGRKPPCSRSQATWLKCPPRRGFALREKRGFEVTTVGDGRVALDELKKSVFDLVLMDVQMPTMDGFEATAPIREIEKLRGGHIPIVAMTAHALKEDEEPCIAAGMDAYISKPIRTSELYTAIENCILSSNKNEDSKADLPAKELLVPFK
jgi:two-component system, sensor histidine kinase and response regulator